MPDLEDAGSSSRLQRFRRIMETAAGAATADYMNHPRFWNMALPELRNFELYGIAMMRAGGAPGAAAAPPAAAPQSCCHGEDHCHAAVFTRRR
jgi:hypothetical protein